MMINYLKSSEPETHKENIISNIKWNETNWYENGRTMKQRYQTNLTKEGEQ